ncbi:hypothetical protein EJD97_011087 [Solanum chilense]|uniref:Uncharacterized protein n=1 Tax=Solanum chilense TaxID=4083 RepID=A0A6N2BG47_SOLCI|nr:hypothetical protein EJD97_011087 [Solanum chilense]
MAGGNAELKERMTRLEALIGATNDGENLVYLVTQVQRMSAELTLTKEVLNEKVLMLDAEYETKHDTTQQEMEVVRREKEDIHGEVFLLRWALQETIDP